MMMLVYVNQMLAQKRKAITGAVLLCQTLSSHRPRLCQRPLTFLAIYRRIFPSCLFSSRNYYPND